jgi:hypothetical protein
MGSEWILLPIWAFIVCLGVMCCLTICCSCFALCCFGCFARKKDRQPWDKNSGKNGIFGQNPSVLLLTPEKRPKFLPPFFPSQNGHCQFRHFLLAIVQQRSNQFRKAIFHLKA